MYTLYCSVCQCLIDCCPTLNVWFENDVKDKQGLYEGVYTIQGFSNERQYWVDAEGENAIWYIPDWKDWAIGSADKIGTKYRHMRTTNDLQALCPYNDGYVLSWDYRDSNSYDDNTWITTNDVYINCTTTTTAESTTAGNKGEGMQGDYFSYFAVTI